MTSRLRRDLPPPNPDFRSSADFWARVQMMSDAELLARAFVLFAGRAATDAETAQVAAGGAAAWRSAIRAVIQVGPAFDSFLIDAAMTQFLTLRTNPFLAISEEDYPVKKTLPFATDGLRFFKSAQREPNEFVRLTVERERPWTDVVMATSTYLNGPLASLYDATPMQPFKDATDLDVWRPANIPAPARIAGTQLTDAAGVLSSAAWRQLSGHADQPQPPPGLVADDAVPRDRHLGTRTTIGAGPCSSTTSRMAASTRVRGSSFTPPCAGPLGPPRWPNLFDPRAVGGYPYA